MHVGVICSPNYLEPIKEALAEHLILLEKSGFFEPEEFDAHTTSAINVDLDLLIIDMLCANDDAIIRGIRKYRIAKSSRVIVIAPGREPGDPTMSVLVADGVYDIISPQIKENDEASSFNIVLSLQKQINTVYHMGNAARWRVFNEEKREKTLHIKIPKIKLVTDKSTQLRNSPEPKTQFQDIDDFELIDDLLEDAPLSPKKTEVIERFIGTVSISVFSPIPRTGSSFTALQIANWLSQRYRTAYVEIGKKSSEAFKVFESERLPNGFMVDKLSIFPDVQDLEDLLFQDWEYVVIDFGTQWNDHLFAFTRSHLHVLTAHSGDMEPTADLLESLFSRNWKRAIHITITATESGFKSWTNALTRKEKREFQLHFWKQDLHDNPFQNTSLPLEQILNTVLPKKKRSLISKWFKGGAT